MPTTTTRTLHPLPFEHLDPKRFEDLVRQLLYDFRPWRKLEATGRLGSDDGFDARGWELIPALDDEPAPEDDDQDVTPQQPTEDRIWLIQCKRENKLPPKKLQSHLSQIDASNLSNLYGVILAAPSDFSKASRDVVQQWCAEHGVSEWYVWGKAELEDMLFQPKNDHLLFAYFGISLQIRKRSVRTDVRSQIAIKRKLKRTLEKRGFNLPVLLRDPTDDRYPFSDHSKAFEDRDHRWHVYQELGLTFRGLKLVIAQHFAFVDDDGIHWDWANAYNDTLSPHDNPWRDNEERDHKVRHELWQFWHDLPEKNRTTATVIAYLPLDKIIDVDDIGDDVSEHPHIFALWEKDGPPLDCCYIEFGKDRDIDTSKNRIEKFPSRFRRPD